MIDRRLLALPGARRILAALGALALARGLAVAGQAWGLAAAVVALWHGAPIAEAAGWVALFAACYLARLALLWAQDALLDRFAARRAEELREQLMACMLAGGVPLVQRTGTGTLAALAVEGVDQVRSYIHLVLPKVVGVAAVPLVIAVFLFALDWVSGLIALVCYPCIILFMVLIGRTAQDEAARQYRTFQLLSNRFIDALRGLDTLALFGRAHAHGARVHEASEEHRAATMRTLRVAMLSSAVLDLFATAALAAVAIMLGFRLIDGSIALFPALTALMLTPEFFKPVREFAADYHASLDGKNALAHIMEIVEGEGEAPVILSIQQPSGLLNPEHREAERRGLDAKHRAESEPKDLPGSPAPSTPQAPTAPAAGTTSALAIPTLELRDISFSYPDRPDALAHITLSAAAPQRIGIVGASGAGKSTLANLLAGLFDPASGTARVNGTPVATLRTPAWLAQVAYIPQQPYIFHATLRENLAFYRPDASGERIREAVSALGLDGLVAALPDGLDTVVGEGARAVSGGQAQRVALARALLDPARRVLVLDEPTAHLDIETELELKARMLPLMEGKLVLFATHRLHWMADMDEVLVLEDGCIVEHGAPQELMQAGGAYTRLCAQIGGGAA